MTKLKFNSTSLLKSLAISFLIFIFFISFSAKSFAATGIYEVVNFQGKVVNKTAGTNVANGNYDFTFKLFSVSSAGSVIWTENFNTANGNQLTVTDGIFRVALGSVCVFTGGSCQGNTNSAVDFNSDSLYLDITFNGETFATRVRLTAVPYAFNAKQVNGLTVTNNGGNTLNIAANKSLIVSNSLTFAGTDSTTITFQGTDTYVGRTTSDTLTNKTIGSTGLTFSAAATDVTTVSNEDLTLAVNGSGNFVLSSDFDSAITLGTAISNEFPLLVRNGIGNNAALAVDNLNTGDIFTASSAGITKFSITSAGGIKLGATEGINGDCLKSGGVGAAATFGSCGSGSQTPWAQDIDADNFSLLDLGTNITARAALTITSTGSNTLTFDSGNNIITFAATDTTLTASGLATITSASALAISAATLELGGTGASTIQTNSNDDLTLTPNGSGNLILTADFDSQVLIGATGATTEFPLLVRNGIGSNAALAVDNLNSGDIFTASAAGTTKFTLSSAGVASFIGGQTADITSLGNANLTVSAGGTGELRLLSDADTDILLPYSDFISEDNSVLYTGVSGKLSAVTTTTSGQCLVSAAANNAPTWATCPGGSGGSNWTLNTTNGTISPNNGTVDLVLGFGTAAASTASAKFSVTNLAGTLSPIASLSGTTGSGGNGNGLVFNTSGTNATIQSLRNNTLTIGGGTTGNIVLRAGEGIVFIGENEVKNGGLTFYSSGAGITDPTITTDASGNLTISAGQSGASVIVGDGSGNISLSLTAAADGLIADKTVTLAAAYSGTDFTFNRVLTSDQAAENMSGAVLYVTDTSTGLSNNTATGDLILGNAALTTTPFTGNLLRLQKSGSDRVIITHSGQIGTGVTPVSQLQITRPLSYEVTGKALAVFDQIENQDIFTASAAGTPIFTITRSGGIALGTNGLTFGTASDCLKGGSTASWGSCGTGGGGSSNWTQNSGLGIIKPNNDTLDILFGGTSTSSAKFAFMNMDSNSGLDPLASFSGNLMLESRPNSSVTQQTTWTKISQTTAGTVMSSGTTNISSISAMTVYNGSLYVGTFKGAAGSAGEAEVYRYKGTNSSWEKVSHATPGTIGGTGTPTSGIASVSAMTVYDGKLYIGTSKMNGAEVYRYDGGTTWIKVSNGAAGTLGGTSNIDGISAMAVYQGQLYAGTREHTTSAGTAQLYRYTKGDGANDWTVINSTTGQFVATNTVGTWAVTSMVVKNGYLYFGVLKPGDADVLRYTGGAGIAAPALSMNLASLTGSYLINGTAVTAFSEVTAMATYNGNLVVGLRKPGGAEVLMLNDGGGMATVPNAWARLNFAAGQMVSGGTSAIDSVSSLAVYNGSLYIGTQKANSAEIYRYTGDSERMFKVTGAAGTIAAGGTSSIDGVVKMIQSNGDLVAATMELGAAEVYKLTTKPIDSSYALQFHAKPSYAGGEQNSVSNYASIFFMASASANLGSNAGNGGAFVFSHGIQTKNGSYDVAEDYPTRDDALEPGDLVSIDTNERGFVKRSTVALDAGVIGVYSEKPALRLTQEDVQIDGGRAIPVALAGRVPVKVSTENGVIKPGDYLTASSVPGVAMKADRSGNVVGQAMAGFSEEGIGKVLVYVRSNSYTGTTAKLFEGIDSHSINFEQKILSKLLAKDKEGLVSEVNTDRLIAGLDIITPKIVADEITVKRLKAESIEGLDIITGRLSIMDSSFASLSAIFANNYIEISSKEAKTINTNLTGSLVLSGLDVNGIATISADLRVKGSGLVEGIFSVVDTLVTNNLIVNGVTNFFAQVIFKDDVIFEGRPIFNSDTGGSATIKKDSDRIEIVFEKEYEKAPVINANIAFEQKKNSDGLAKDSKELEKKVFEKNYLFVVVNKSEKGFIIVLNKKAEDDIEFSWIAIAIKENKLSFSKGVVDFVKQVLSPTPSVLGSQSAIQTDP